MTLGRLATFLAILAISLAVAKKVVHRRWPPFSPTPHAAAKLPGSLTEPAVARKRAPARAPSPGGAPDGGAARQLDPMTDALCPEGMLLVDGTTCAETSHRCEALDPANPARCLRYAPAQCRQGLSYRFCIDRDEYPNQEGMLPAVMITFEQAESACTEEEKRLCAETEWALACQGTTGLTFPYGDERDPGACNVEKKLPSVRPEELWEPRDVAPALERLDRRTASGAMPRCVSPFGVRDLAGNVEEWVKSDTAGIAQALRGGEYGSDPTCLTVRKMRTPGFRQFHTGFRCCKDPLVRVPRRGAENGGGTLRPVAPEGRFD